MSKILTPKEIKILHNTDFFKVKASATKKIEHLFTDVRDEIKSVIEKEKKIFPKEVDATNGKIFRGENYLGLPYLVLDYPKHFSKESIFAFRTMFWWGNFFSFTMHLQGKALAHLTPNPSPQGEGSFTALRKNNVYICVNNNPWQYHYKKDNYLSIDALSDAALKKILLEKEFIKLSRKIPLNDYKKLNAFCKESFKLFVQK